jgi:hypothetical protein
MHFRIEDGKKRRILSGLFLEGRVIRGVLLPQSGMYYLTYRFMRPV